MELKENIIKSAYKLMEIINKGYQWYTDTPEQPFEYSEGSIWLINPETGEWILELEKSGVLWYEYETPDSFSKYLNMGKSDFQSFIKIWMEDALKRGVDSTLSRVRRSMPEVEDALKRGVSSTISEWEGIQRHQGVEDALNRGVVSVVRNEINWDDEIKDVLENGIVTTYLHNYMVLDRVTDAVEKGTVTTVKLGEWSQVGVGDVIKNGNTIKNQEI